MSVKESILQGYNATRDFSQKSLHAACYAPWVSLYFDTMGNVQACCQNTKFPLGNIAMQTIDEIWQGKKIRSLRKALAKDNFAAGCQFCEWQISVGNYLGTFTRNFERLPVLQEEPEWPSMMEFSISNTCNLECIMCNGTFSSTIRSRREALPPLPKPYSDHFFAELRKYLPHLKFAKFLGGEPFLAQESYRIWDMMIEDGLKIPCHVTTNGTQWNERVERVLENVPCSFSISMDGVTKKTVESVRVNAPFEVVRANFLKFLAYARARGTYIGLTYCLMRQNWHEFGDYLLFADEHDCEVVVNTVREPPHCSLYTLSIDELSVIADALEKQGETLLPRLGRNRNVWETHVGAIRLRIENERESTRAPFKTPLSLFVIDLASFEKLPPDQRMNDARAETELHRWGGDHPLYRLSCDADDRILEVKSDDGTFFGVPAEQCIGRTFTEVVQELRSFRGDGIVIDLHSSGQYVDRLIDFLDASQLFTMRVISVPVLNEHGLHGGSQVIAMGQPCTADTIDEVRRASELLSIWSHGAPVVILHRDVRDVVESIEEQGAAAVGINRGEWIGKTFAELGPLIVKQYGLFGDTINQAMWELTLQRCDRVFSFRGPKRIASFREIMVRRFDASGQFLGWTSLFAAMSLKSDNQVMSFDLADKYLTEWAPEGQFIQIHCDLKEIIEGIEGGELAGIPTHDLIGRHINEVGTRLVERHGIFEYRGSEVFAGYSDRRLEFDSKYGPLYLRAISWPRFNGTTHIGETQLLRVRFVTADSLGKSENEVIDELEKWAGKSCRSAVLIDRNRRIQGFEGYSDSEWDQDPALIGEPIEAFNSQFRQRFGVEQKVEQLSQPPGLWDFVVEHASDHGIAKTRAIGVPRFDQNGLWLGWAVRIASLIVNVELQKEYRKRVEERLGAQLPGVPIVHLFVDPTGIVTAMDASSLAGLSSEEIIGKSANAIGERLAQRWQAMPSETFADTTEWCSERHVEFDGDHSQATVHAVYFTNFQPDGIANGTELILAVRQVEQTHAVEADQHS